MHIAKLQGGQATPTPTTSTAGGIVAATTDVMTYMAIGVIVIIISIATLALTLKKTLILSPLFFSFLTHWATNF